MKINFPFFKYLPWNWSHYLEDEIYRIISEYEPERYRRWLFDNASEEPLRERRRDTQIITTGVDFETNSPKLRLLRIKSRNPYKNHPMTAVPPE
ncbi:MAG: hypothetical protein HYW22_01400 [Candidatus Aenigmarchaeota archaeon]|nr:hypothetical protein [Candidatus Aenigmarchaeota archaeon]